MAAFWGSAPTRTMFASAPALHSAAWAASALRSSASANTMPTAFSPFSSEPAVIFIKAPAAYSFAVASPVFTIFMRWSMVPPFANSCFTSGHLQERFMIPKAASAIPSFSSARNGGPEPADQTASQGPSSAASIAKACAAWRLASSESERCWMMATSEGIMSGACWKPACTFALWSLKRFAKAPAALSLTASSSSVNTAAKAFKAPASTILSLIFV
mmetsp:Transcript_18347/g.64431  ORF Transcript_18347/g.64431 Transcript_18347/m.64431 type:complete len:216 (+) Transcript_18347:283-930(+)